MNAKTCKKLRRLAWRRTAYKRTEYVAISPRNTKTAKVAPQCFRGHYLWLKKQHASRTLQT